MDSRNNLPSRWSLLPGSVPFSLGYGAVMSNFRVRQDAASDHNSKRSWWIQDSGPLPAEGAAQMRVSSDKGRGGCAFLRRGAAVLSCTFRCMLTVRHSSRGSFRIGNRESGTDNANLWSHARSAILKSRTGPYSQKTDPNLGFNKRESRCAHSVGTGWCLKSRKRPQILPVSRAGRPSNRINCRRCSSLPASVPVLQMFG